MISRFLRTLWYLQPSQVIGQAMARLHRAKPRQVAVPSIRPRSRAWIRAVWKHASLEGPHTFSILNKTYDVPGPADWDRPDQLFLWKYNLHYFDYLNAAPDPANIASARALVARWVAEHGSGLGWEPYPMSLRVCNWIRYHWETEKLTAEAIASLACQADLLDRSIEYHIGANHLFTNGKALLFAGEFFTGPAADRWRARGLGILSKEIPRQFFPDGGHYERTPMYHAILLEDLLDVANLIATRPTPDTASLARQLADTIRRALNWLQAMTLANGVFPLFGDAAHGIAPYRDDLAAYAQRLGYEASDPASPAVYLPESGFVRLQAGQNAVLFATVQGPKPDHQPGHSHADTFSFELFVNDRPVLVDAGVPTYERCAERHKARGTAMHNTLQIQDADSSEVWSSFRVGRRARVSNVEWLHHDGRQVFSAMHDGYRWLPGRPRHTRSWAASADGFSVEDTLVTASPQAVTIRFRAAPGLRWRQVEGAAWQLEEGSKPVIRVAVDHRLAYKVASDRYYPEFNRSEMIEVLEARGIMADSDHRMHCIRVIEAAGAPAVQSRVAEKTS
jgi:uncharacterized heparinase superfamily protein